MNIAFNHKCKLCKKTKGEHKNGTLGCPIGSKTKIGYLHFSDKDFFIPSEKQPKQPEFLL